MRVPVGRRCHRRLLTVANINVGAVGQPRDNNPKCAYVIYDMDAQTIELRRLDYDIETAQKKIRAAGLPERLAERLAYGR